MFCVFVYDRKEFIIRQKRSKIKKKVSRSHIIGFIHPILTECRLQKYLSMNCACLTIALKMSEY